MQTVDMLSFRLFGIEKKFNVDIQDIFSRICKDDILVLFDVDFYVGNYQKADAEFPAFPKYPNYCLKILQQYADTLNVFCYCFTRGENIDIVGLGGDLLGNKKYVLSCLYDNNMELFMKSQFYKKIKDDIIAIGGANNYISGDYDYNVIVSNDVAFIKFTDGCPNTCGFCCCKNRPFNVRKLNWSDDDYEKLKKVFKVVILDENLGCKLFRFEKIVKSILDIKTIKKVEITNGFDYRFVLANEKNRDSFFRLAEDRRLKAMFAYDGKLNEVAEKCYNGDFGKQTNRYGRIDVYTLYGNMRYKNKYELCKDLYYNISLKSRDSCHTDPQLRYPALNDKNTTMWLKLFSAGNIVSRHKLAKEVAYKSTGDNIFLTETKEDNFIVNIDNDFFSKAFQENNNTSIQVSADFLLSMGIHWTLCVTFLLNHANLISRRICESLEINDVSILNDNLFIEKREIRDNLIGAFARYILAETDNVVMSINKLKEQEL